MCMRAAFLKEIRSTYVETKLFDLLNRPLVGDEDSCELRI